MTDKYSHHHHILPLKIYLGIGGILILLTLVTVAVSHVHLGAYNLVVAMAIAALKATLVGLFFMHLLYDNKLFGVIFLSSLCFLGIFIIIILFDTLRRGDIYPEVALPIKDKAAMYENIPKSQTHESGEHEGGK